MVTWTIQNYNAWFLDSSCIIRTRYKNNLSGTIEVRLDVNTFDSLTNFNDVTNHCLPRVTFEFDD